MFNLDIFDNERCIFFALGRNAMYAVCMALKLKAGDEVLTPAFDCDSALQPFKVLGLYLRFFHSDPYSFSVDVEDIKRKVNSRTRLIHIINYFGMPQPWDKILAIRKATGIPILEDNAYSLFSKLNGKCFGTFGDFSVFSLRKNLLLTDGGLLRINNAQYHFSIPKKKIPFCHVQEFPDLLRIITRKLRVNQILKYPLRLLPVHREFCPPLYSEMEKGFPACPRRDAVDKRFSCDYLRPMSRLAEREINKVNNSNIAKIIAKKKEYYYFLAQELSNTRGIKVLWTKLPEGIVPFCLSCLIIKNRDVLSEILRRKYDTMVWPTLSKLILEQLDNFPEVELLGRQLMQINLPADKVVSADFSKYLKKLINDMICFSEKYL